MPNIVNGECERMIDSSAENVRHKNDGEPRRILEKVAGKNLGEYHGSNDENFIWILLML